MRRVVVAVVLIVLATSAFAAPGLKLGLGAFAGLSLPIAQSDQASGTEFGFRLRIKAIPVVILEPNLTFTKWGKPGTVDGIDLGIDGSKLTSFGIDAVLGGAPGVPGFKPFFVIGAGSFKIKNDDTQFEQTRLGYRGGLGFLIGFVPKLDVDARGTLLVIPLDGGGSKKAVGVTAGLTWNF